MRHVSLALLCALLVLPSSALAQQGEDWGSAGDITPRDQRAVVFDIEWAYSGAATAVYRTSEGLFQNDRRRGGPFLEPFALGGPKVKPVFDVSRDTGLGAPFVAWYEPASIGAGGTILTALRNIENQRGNPSALAGTDGAVLELRGAGRLPQAAALWREETADGSQIIRFAEADAAGEPQEPVTLAAGESFSDLKIATSYDNMAIAVWTDADKRVWMAARTRRATSFGKPFALTPRGSRVVGKTAFSPTFVRFQLAYVEKRGSSPARAVAIRGRVDKTDVSRAVFPAVSKSGAGATDVQLLYSGRPRITVAWRESGVVRTAISRGDETPWSIQTAARGGGANLRAVLLGRDEVGLLWLDRNRIRGVKRLESGRWGKVASVSPANVTAFDVGAPNVDGDAQLIAWTRVVPGKLSRVELAELPAQGALKAKVSQALAKLDPDTEVPRLPQVAATGEFARAAWWRVDGPGGRSWWQAAAEDTEIEPAAKR